jgi:hypothetical protein
MHLTVKVDLIGHSKMDLVLSLLVGLNSRFVTGPSLDYTFVSHNNHMVMNHCIPVVMDE